jgi:transcriptional regulator with XRE-family HTH domain
MMTAAELKARETKECGLCKCAIERGTLDNYHWNRMRYCSRRCSALHRGVLIGGWRNDKKECKVCGVLFSPRPGIPKGCWRKLKCCSEECTRKAQTGRSRCADRTGPKYRFHRVPMNPAECKTPSQRLRFLRLSKSPEGEKKPIGVEEMARLAKIGHSTLSKIETGDPTVPAKCIEKLCAALKIPLDMMHWSDKKWVRVVTGISLTAYELRKTESK